jgi:hypothetical protein
MYGSLWKLTWTKLTSVEAEPSHPSTKCTVPVTSRRNHQTGVWLSVKRRKVTECAANMHSAERRVFIVREHRRTGSFEQWRKEFRNKYGEESVPTKSCIHILVKKLETTGNVLTRYAGGRKMLYYTVQDVSFFFTRSTATLGPGLWFFSFMITLQIGGLLGRVISSS